MYKEDKGQLKVKVFDNWVEVIEPAVLFDLERDNKTAILNKHGFYDTIKTYQNLIEKAYTAHSIDAEFTLIRLADLTENIEKQATLMNYLIAYSNTQLAYNLAAVPYSKRREVAQDILGFQERVAV